MEYKTIENLNEEAAKYQNVPSSELVELFKNNHIYLPDFVHRFLLANFLKKYVFEAEKVATYTDEFLYRLRSYNFFSVYLLEQVVKVHSLSVNMTEYKNLFMRFFLKNIKKFKTSIAFEKSLSQLSAKYKTAVNEDFEDSMKSFSEIFYTAKGYLDGLPLSILKESIDETYTLQELKDLGTKYNIDVPRRINKSQLADIVSSRLKLTEEETALLSSKSILDITIYSKEKGFKISTDLKKSDMVEFIIYSLSKYHEDSEKDLFNYDILLPEELNKETVEQSSLVHSEQGLPTSNEFVESESLVEPEEKEEEVVQKQKEEEKIPEAAPEIKKAPVVEEKPVEEEAEEQAPEIYYDESVDDEIRHIIKTYYKKKAKRDRGARWIMVVIFILLVGALAYFVLKYYGVF